MWSLSGRDMALGSRRVKWLEQERASQSLNWVGRDVVRIPSTSIHQGAATDNHAAAGSFPYSLFQCLGDLNISGISRWRLPDEPTRLFQLILGDGQHALVARGMPTLQQMKPD